MLAIAAFISSCKKADQPLKGNAYLVGEDARMCLCCGGLEVTIDGFPNPIGNAYFLVHKLPNGFNLGTKPKFPIRAEIDYSIDTSSVCYGINIKRITIY